MNRTKSPLASNTILLWVVLFFSVGNVLGQDSTKQASDESLKKLPGATEHPAGFFEIQPYDKELERQCEKGIICMLVNALQFL